MSFSGFSSRRVPPTPPDGSWTSGAAPNLHKVLSGRVEKNKSATAETTTAKPGSGPTRRASTSPSRRTGGPLPPPLDFLTPQNFAGHFPTTESRIDKFPPAQIAKDARSTRVILHPRMPDLLKEFLLYKRANGSVHEKTLYATMDWRALAARMIEKRPLCFTGADDYTRLRNNTWGGKMKHEWDRVGRDTQFLNQTLTLDEYMSYDEIMLASLLGTSGPSYFINSGARDNKAELYKEQHTRRGVIVGLVGTRFSHEGQMDTPIMFAPKKITDGGLQDPGVTQMIQTWLAPTESPGGGRDGMDYFDDVFDIGMYKARMRITFDMLLLEAQARAVEERRDARVHVVGFGLGVWAWTAHQREQRVWFVEALAEAIEELDLANIGTVEIGWTDVDRTTRDLVIKAGENNAIDVRFVWKDPCRYVYGEDGETESDELLVVSWAWDGNSFIGNEYWSGYLAASSDPAAVCYSTIGDLHNPLINPFTHRLKVLSPEKEKDASTTPSRPGPTVHSSARIVPTAESARIVPAPVSASTVPDQLPDQPDNIRSDLYRLSWCKQMFNNDLYADMHKKNYLALINTGAGTNKETSPVDRFFRALSGAAGIRAHHIFVYANPLSKQAHKKSVHMLVSLGRGLAGYYADTLSDGVASIILQQLAAQQLFLYPKSENYRPSSFEVTFDRPIPVPAVVVCAARFSGRGRHGEVVVSATIDEGQDEDSDDYDVFRRSYASATATFTKEDWKGSQCSEDPDA